MQFLALPIVILVLADKFICPCQILTSSERHISADASLDHKYQQHQQNLSGFLPFQAESRGAKLVLCLKNASVVSVSLWRTASGEKLIGISRQAKWSVSGLLK